MKVTVLFSTVGLFLTFAAGKCAAQDLPWEIPVHHSPDPLAQRDEWGLLHQGKSVNDTDFARRYPWRWIYYFKAPEQLMVQPAYVGALQRDLKRLGYYCGPVNGVFSDEVSDAIARLQKNSSLRVTGTLNDPVRRALHLP
jgi:Putative peptidoglycan binding domain